MAQAMATTTDARLLVLVSQTNGNNNCKRSSRHQTKSTEAKFKPAAQ